VAISETEVLVTGAGGMIGSAVVAALHTTGVRVHAHVGPAGFAGAPLPDGVARSWCDVLELGPSAAAAQAIVHLAGPPSVAGSFADPTAYVRDHVLGTAAVLTAAPSARLVYVSSAEVYGRPVRNPVAEAATTWPLSPYGAAKLGAEALVRSLRPDATILRPFSVYGPASPPTSLLGRLLGQAVAEDAVRLRDLTPVRDYVHVDDVARAICRSLEVAAPGTFNVGSGLGTSVGTLARLVCSAAGRPDLPVLELGADRPADIHELIADPAHAADVLGWWPTMTLAEGAAAIVSAHGR